MASKFFAALFGRRPPATPTKAKPSAAGAAGSRINAYQAVSIIHSRKACPAAIAEGERRFLARRAPTLPLPDCDRPDRCTCRFQKYPERRAGAQRLQSVNEVGRWYPGRDKRVKKGRRLADL
jgi:hypothetical protein